MHIHHVNVLISTLNPIVSGSIRNISSNVVKGACMKLPLLFALKPFFLNALVCFIRSLMLVFSSLFEKSTDIDRCFRVSPLMPLMTGLIKLEGDGGRDARGVR